MHFVHEFKNDLDVSIRRHRPNQLYSDEEHNCHHKKVLNNSHFLTGLLFELIGKKRYRCIAESGDRGRNRLACVDTEGHVLHPIGGCPEVAQLLVKDFQPFRLFTFLFLFGRTQSIDL